MHVLEFFAGIGLMRLGLEKAGWRVIWANDIEPEKERLYHGNFDRRSAEFVIGDVHEIDGASLPTAALATASFPCNDLSLAGARRGLSGSQSSSFWGFISAIKAMRARSPSLILLENVTGFLTSNDGNDFRDACLALNRLGYAVDAFILDAAHFVPQSRQRLFVVGSKDFRQSKILESPSLFEEVGRPAALADFILWHPEIRWAIRKLPKLPSVRRNFADIVEEVPANSALWWNKGRAEYLINQMSPKHRAIAETLMVGTKTTYGTVFRRVRNGRSMAELRTDGLAGCLRTPRGGSGRQILFVGGRGKYAVRLLTPRECARLMGADDFDLKAGISPNQALFGFGDAVCVPVIEWIATNYLNPLLHEASEPAAAVRKPVRYGKA